MLFATPSSATSTGADDQPSPGIVAQLESTPTPYPTATPYPTPTPFPAVPPAPTLPPDTGERTGPTPAAATSPAPVLGPTIRIAIPKKSEVKHPKADTTLNGLIDRVEAGEITAEEAAKEAPLHRGESVGVIILLSGNVEGVVAFLKANGASNISADEDYIEAYVPILLLGQTSEQQGVLRVDQIQPPGETQGTSQVVGNGPGVHGSIAWNEAGYSGQGIKVGVITLDFRGFRKSWTPRCRRWLGPGVTRFWESTPGILRIAGEAPTAPSSRSRSWTSLPMRRCTFPAHGRPRS